VTGWGVLGDPPLMSTPLTEGAPEQQLHVQGGQVVFAGQAAQAHAQPPPPVPAPPSGGGLMRMHEPVGHGVVKQAICNCTQAHASAESAVQEDRSVCAVQGSAGWGVAQSHGAQAAPSGQAGQTHTAEWMVEPEVPPAPLAVPVPPGLLPTAIVVVIVVMAPHAQLQAAQSAPTGHWGQLQVQVPLPEPEPHAPLEPPVEPPVPPVPVVPAEPPEPVLPPEPVPQSHLQGGQAWPGWQAGQLQLQVPALEPPGTGGKGGGQSQLTVGQLPLLGQATGCTHAQPLPLAPRARQKPDAVQSCPAGQRAGVVSVACVAVQAHRVSPEQARESV
jgi:hypothetical protein